MNNSARKELQSRQNLKAWGVGLAVKRRSLRDGRTLSLDNPFHKTWEKGATNAEQLRCSMSVLNFSRKHSTNIRQIRDALQPIAAGIIECRTPSPVSIPYGSLHVRRLSKSDRPEG